MPGVGFDESMKPHRIAAGGIVLKEDTILLVRYPKANDSSYLVGPGGALESGENAIEAIARETIEETGITVRPHKVLFIEDLLCSRFKMCKIWMLCDVVSGIVVPTDGAKAEGIVQAAWFARDQLIYEEVFPSPILQYDWNEFRSNRWETLCLPSQVAGF
jgi:8-oxo-dGTP pyrophosphatase MutT (NUDIX family)